MLITFFKQITTKQLRLTTYIGGSFVISLWTLFRFLTKQMTFDLVGQQLLAHQWLHGFSSGATIGQTNYIIKILFLYIPTDALRLSPFVSMIMYTLLLNIVSFFLILYFAEKIWCLFAKTIPKSFYVLAFWITTLSGSIFWVQYANSRNIEVAGGVLIAYLMLQYYQQRKQYTYVALIVTASILFFADMLQFFMVAVPLMAYLTFVELLSSKKHIKQLVGIGACIAISYALARLALAITSNSFSLSIVGPDQQNGLGILFRTPFDAMLQFLRLYMGGFELGHILTTINISLLVIVLLLSIFSMRRWNKKHAWHIAVLSFFVLVFNIVIYVASNQVSTQGSFRYLIMTVPFVLLLGTYTLQQSSATVRNALLGVLVAISIISSLSIIIQTTVAALNRNSPNVQVKAATTFSKSYDFTFASMDTALPSDYMSGNKVSILPLECNNGKLRMSHLFFDRSYYERRIKDSNQLTTPIILDGDAITNKPYSCSIDAIEKQLGAAGELTQLSNDSFVLLYPTAQLLRAL